MLFRAFAALVCAAPLIFAGIVADVRSSIGKGDFAGAEKLVAEYKSARGVTPELILAVSWLGRGALAAKQLDNAERYAIQARELALAELKKRPLDAEENLPLALGASIEVQGHVLAGRGERDQAVQFLQTELQKWRGTSMRARIQKNIHLLSLEGKPAPKLELSEHLGPKPVAIASLKGNPVLLFFWAHWCGDCKYQSPILAKLKTEFAAGGLKVVAPTQRYGYGKGGEDATPEQELKHIEATRQEHYAALLDVPAPVSKENFDSWGVSTTPTLVLIDRGGVVRMYHPGRMTYEDLRARIAAVAGASGTPSSGSL